jgi:ribosomal protein S18 acetylase RimI-like enzyme
VSREIAIRRARGEDVDTVKAIVRDAYARYVPRMGREPAPMRADYAALVGEELVWVAARGEEIVGVVVLRPGAATMLLENVAVAPAWQRRGVGRALIGFAEDRARAVGAREITLYTNELMTENLALYPALGYEETGRRSEAGFRRVFFRKGLAEPR